MNGIDPATADIDLVALEHGPVAAYVRELTTGLGAAGLRVACTVRAGLATLTVANPAVSAPGQAYPLLSEKISVRRPCGGEQWLLYWSWGEVLGPADRIAEAVDALSRVLAHVPARDEA